MLKLRKAVPQDIPLILSFIRELAEYERAPNAVSCTEKDLRRDGFGANPKFRGKSIGRALMARLAKTAIAEQCYGVRWEVLDWNKPAIDVYQHLGSKFREGWRIMQIIGPELKELAESASAHISKD